MDGLTDLERNQILDAMEVARPKHPLESEGWVYVSPRAKFTLELWAQYLAIYGEGEYLILCESWGTHSCGTEWRRGQLLVSPKGQSNLVRYVAQIRSQNPAQTH